MIFRLSFLLNLLSVKIFIRPQLFVILSAVVASSVGNWPEKWSMKVSVPIVQTKH